MTRRSKARRPRHHTGTPAVVTRTTAFQDLPQFMTVAETCTVLNLARSTVYDLIRRGDLPVRRFGRVLRIPKAGLRSSGIFPEC
jgi:excisionase family DNA binding protein